jgi:ornithine carbamoyltransferase
MTGPVVPHLMTLADLSVPQIRHILTHSRHLKRVSLPWLDPLGAKAQKKASMRLPSQSLFNKSIALLFSKRSTRTRLSAETSTVLLGGRALFLGREDIQLGVNESPRDTARVIGGMCQGIFARVGNHEDIEVFIPLFALEDVILIPSLRIQELAKYSPVPVLNALSSLWHPTQILADLLTLHEHAHLFDPNVSPPAITDKHGARKGSLPKLRPLTVAYVGDSANVLHDMLVTYPRLGHTLRVASPEQYRAPIEVWDRVKELGCDEKIWWGTDPREAVKGADVVVTDTWFVFTGLLSEVY